MAAQNAAHDWGWQCQWVILPFQGLLLTCPPGAPQGPGAGPRRRRNTHRCHHPQPCLELCAAAPCNWSPLVSGEKSDGGGSRDLAPHPHASLSTASGWNQAEVVLGLFPSLDHLETTAVVDSPPSSPALCLVSLGSSTPALPWTL